MPGIISHFLCAEKAYGLIREKNLTGSQKDAYLWGAQGPDLLFYHRFFPWDRGNKLIEYGTRIHNEKPSLMFEITRQYQNRGPALPDAANAFILGNLCHYALDRAAHPFVLYGVRELKKTREYPPSMNLHALIESSLDIILLRAEKDLLAPDLDLRSAIPKNREVSVMLPDFYKYFLRRRFGADPGTRELNCIYSDAIRMFGILNDKTMLKKPAVEMIEGIFRKKGVISTQIHSITEGDEWDYANIGNMEWENPMSSSNPKTDSFFDIFRQAVLDSVNLAQAYTDALKSDTPMRSILGDISFANGTQLN